MNLVVAPNPSQVTSAERVALEVLVTGVCQGVGFRPFLHRLANHHGIAGWARNESGSVRIVCEGPAESLHNFVGDIQAEAPPLARVDGVRVTPHRHTGFEDFRVLRSEVSSGSLPLAPDAGICRACEAEMNDPTNRRFQYAFITCTDCGPRFTVIESMPYDRERTTMRPFTQCPDCAAEYAEPENRRYHSETNSCPACGPRLWFEEGQGTETVSGQESIQAAADLLRSGKILAVRGLGGFHLAVDALDDAAVRRLRVRKGRNAKPLAVMVRTLGDAERLGRVGKGEAEQLSSRERPIVLLDTCLGSGLAPSVSSGLGTVGVMLAYTPLHQLLLDAVARPLVMTSGNLSDEPIATGNDEARRRLLGVADGYLLHDREIVSRYDDSVVRCVGKRVLFLRRARGYAPLPLRLPIPSSRALLAVGSHLKNTFTLAAGDSAYVSQHIGDLESLDSVEHFQDSLQRFEALFRIEPEVVVRDAHPGYMSTRLAYGLGCGEPMTVHHHHAHVAAVAGEHGVTSPVLGLAFDGTGLGDDNRTWGAEFLAADLTGYRRLAHLRYAPLPGGDLAARRPWRSALGYLSLEPAVRDAFRAAFVGVAPTELHIARRQIERELNAPLASSMGRLFDAAAAVIGVRGVNLFEGHAAMELESLAASIEAEPLPFPVVKEEDGMLVLDPLPLLSALGELHASGGSAPVLAARFHESVAAASTSLVVRLCEEAGLDTVVLAGGCFQNARLLTSLTRRLEGFGLRVLFPELLGPNDGAISYGQAVVAAARLAVA